MSIVGPNGFPIRRPDGDPPIESGITVLIVKVERDGSFTFLAPDTMGPRHLEALKGAFFRWMADYKRGGQSRQRVQGD